MGAKPTKPYARLLCRMHRIKNLPGPSLQQRAVAPTRLSLGTRAARTAQSPESCLLEIVGLSLGWKQLDSFFVVLNNCTSLWQAPQCYMAHDGVSGSGLGFVCVMIH